MLNHIPFTLASPSWYDVPWAPGSPYLTGDISVLPADSPRWTTTIRGPWQIHMPPRPTLPEVGWKVHVSAKPSELESVASVVALWCVRHSVPFKVLRTRGLVHASQVKDADRSQSGKVCTCYPDGESLEHFCSGLAELLQNVDSPPVSGELRVGSSPLWLRHGSFREAWAVSSTGVPFPVYPGTTHPDRRGPAPAESDHDTPWIRRLRRTNRPSTVLPIDDVRLLHQSNAGGVYQATWRDGTSVVVKEARHLSGLDAAGVDARVRLRHEYEALRRLDPYRAAPHPIDLIETEDGSFLIMEFLDGMTVHQEMSRFHPLIGRRPHRLSMTDFSRWCREVEDRLRNVTRVMAGCGIVHGDLHPANLIHVGHEVLVTDFESCSIDGVAVSSGIAAPWFQSDDTIPDPATTDDLHTLLVDPTCGPALVLHPNLRALISQAAVEDMMGNPTGLPHAWNLEDVTSELAKGIRASATPARADRLFPSDPYLFGHPGSEFGLMHGAAGIMAALAVTGYGVDANHVTWMKDRLATRPTLLPGLANGIEGIALGLSLCGQNDMAASLLHQSGILTITTNGSTDLTLGTGMAGRACALQSLSQRLSSKSLAHAAYTLWEQLAVAVRNTDVALPNGLFSGWEGIGLSLLASPLPDRHDLARHSLRLALATTTIVDGALFSGEGQIRWPYLGRGPAACGPLAARLDDDQTAKAVAQTCRCPLTESSGLHNGRAGLLLVLRQLVGDQDDAVRRHLMRLSWSMDRREEGTLLLGDHGLRFSSDLATGSAGALLALSRDPWRNMTRMLGICDDTCHGPLVTV